MYSTRSLPAARNAATTASESSWARPGGGVASSSSAWKTQSGVRARGLTLAVQPSAQAIAPTAGRVAFAGPYRDYGQILIIDHGGGWTTLITGLHRLSVRVGDDVRQEDPVGVTGNRRSDIIVELRRNGRPVDIVPLIGPV